MLECYFFRCYYAYLLGDQEQTRMYYDWIREEYKKNPSPTALTDLQLRELKKIRDALKTGTIARNEWIDPVSEVEYLKKDYDLKQDALLRKIYDEGTFFIKMMLDEDVNLVDIEQPCPPYGRVDMVYKGKRYLYPVEVKKDEGRHDLIGQINKYTLYYKLRLHYKLYEGVQPLTICGSYDPYTLGELKSAGVIPLMYGLDKLGALTLSKV